MLKLFIPRSIGSQQILPEKRLAVHITKPVIYATLVLIDRKKISVIKSFSERIVTEPEEDFFSATAQALHKVIEAAGEYDTLISSLNGAYCICKPVYFPFGSEEQARLVIEHELEHSLPYKISDAICDAYVTHIHSNDPSLQVIGVATQRQFLETHLEPFRRLGLMPDIITTDVCALYTLSSYIPDLVQSPTPAVLIYIGFNTTTLLLIQNGQYRMSRSLNKGVMQIARSLQQSPVEVMRLLELSDSKTTMTEPTRKALLAFWREIEFTIDSFLKHGASKDNAHIVLAGNFGNLAHMCTIISETSDRTCIPLSLAQAEPTTAIAKLQDIPSIYAISLGAALPAPIAQSFNLLKKEYTPVQTQSIIQTVLISTGLIVATLLGAAVVTWFRSDTLSQQVEAGAKEGIELLQQTFTSKEVRGLDKPITNATASLPSLVKKAKTVVNKQDQLWQKFTQSAQSSFLYHLYILFNEIDQKALGLVIERLSMDSNGIVSLKGHVRDLDALVLLNGHLRTNPHLTIVGTPPQNQSFDIKIQVHNGQG